MIEPIHLPRRSLESWGSAFDIAIDRWLNIDTARYFIAIPIIACHCPKTLLHDLGVLLPKRNAVRLREPGVPAVAEPDGGPVGSSLVGGRRWLNPVQSAFVLIAVNET